VSNYWKSWGTWVEWASGTYPAVQFLPVPPRYADVTVATIGDPELLAAATEYLQHFEAAASQGLGPVFIGAAREYKTVAAVAVLKALWQHQVPVDYLPGGGLLRFEVDRYSEATRKRLKAWESVPVLLVDDFAAPRQNSFGADVVLDVCSARFDAGLPTIWTGNLKLPRGGEFERVEELFGPLFSRRLQDAGAGFTVLVD
jgi:DNA replication protein DnaC